MIGCGLVQNFLAIFLPEWLSNLDVTLLTSYSHIYRLIFRYYTELLKLEPGHKNYTMNRCVALLKLGRTSEVREELFRLDYQYPEDMNVKRVLAWAMLSDNSLDKASQLYDTLLTSTPAHEDYLNAG